MDQFEPKPVIPPSKDEIAKKVKLELWQGEIVQIGGGHSIEIAKTARSHCRDCRNPIGLGKVRGFSFFKGGKWKWKVIRCLGCTLNIRHWELEINAEKYNADTAMAEAIHKDPEMWEKTFTPAKKVRT